jgi:hypothetical protein
MAISDIERRMLKRGDRITRQRLGMVESDSERIDKLEENIRHLWQVINQMRDCDGK